MAHPLTLTLRNSSRLLHLEFDDGLESDLSFEFLRVHSPSAEVKGHGPGQEILQTGKKDVSVLRIEPIGNYAVKLVFDDGHDSGIYTWSYLYKLANNQEEIWEQYLQALDRAGQSRFKNEAG